jgi:glycosyltransferase involved in cell wall biosynthesis
MRQRRIVIVTGNHLCHNPRVLKEAGCLADAGFEVEVLGASLDAGLAARDEALAASQRFRFTPAVRLGLAMRARRRAATWLVQHLSVHSAAAVGYGPHVLLRHAAARDADLYIAHSEPALWAAVQLARRGWRIGVDMEDWFSRDLLPEARRSRPVGLIESLERQALALAAHRTCTSRAMAAALAQAYSIAAPLAIYNAFPSSDRANAAGPRRDRREVAGPSLHWFSQTVGPGRGLEDLFEALPLLRHRVQIHLRGALSDRYREWLESRLPAAWKALVHVHPLVANDELPSRIAEHDIGLALEQRTPPNHDLTVSNKLFQYMQAGLGIVASDTQGQREIAAGAVGIRVYPCGDARALAQAIDAWAADPAALGRARDSNRHAAATRFSWEAIAPALVASVEAALA